MCNLLAIGRLFAVALLLISSVAAQNETQTRAPFVGTWQVGVNQVTGKANITIIVAENGAMLSGKIVFLNPDKTTSEADIKNPSFEGRRFSFQTGSGKDSEPFDWSLTLDNSGKTAVLRGHHHEMLVEETAVKRR